MIYMNLRSALLCISLLTASVTMAQQVATPASSAPEAASSAPEDCVLALRHDHGAEKGTPTPKKACGPAKKKVAKDKAKPLHDHGKVQKNQ